MRTSFCLTSVFLLALATTSPAVVLVDGSALGSPEGFGEINYTPGENVDEFIILGRETSSDPYITSADHSHISPGVNGDGATGNGGVYNATHFSWSGGTPAASGTHNFESFQPVADPNGYGLTPYTWASLSLSAPADTFQFSFFVHDYYTAADLQVLVNGQQVGLYNNVMSSSYLPGGGEGRNTDYYYDFNLSGVGVGQNVEFKFVNMANLGSSWANIGFLSASLNYTAPEAIQNSLFNMNNDQQLPTPSAVPEPGSLGLLVGGLLLIRFARGRRLAGFTGQRTRPGTASSVR